MAIVSSNAGSSHPRRERVLDTQPSQDEVSVRADEGLRPRVLADYIGQPELKQVLGIAVQAAQGRGEALDHVLLYGPPGLGKTTIVISLSVPQRLALF